MTGKIFMIIGRSGSGKDTQVSLLLQQKPELKRIVLCTTRKPRINEEFGVNYYFVTDAVFRSDQINHDVLEYRQFNLITGPAYYYTRKSIFDLDRFNYVVPGTLQMYESYKEAFSMAVVPIYLDCSFDIAKKRLQRRYTESIKEATRRLTVDQEEYTEAHALKCGIPKQNFINAGLPKKSVLEAVLRIVADNLV